MGKHHTLGVGSGSTGIGDGGIIIVLDRMCHLKKFFFRVGTQELIAQFQHFFKCHFLFLVCRLFIEHNNLFHQ